MDISSHVEIILRKQLCLCWDRRGALPCHPWGQKAAVQLHLSALILLLKQVSSCTQNNTPDDSTAIKSCDFRLSFRGNWVLGSFIAFSVFQRLETNYYLKISQSSLLLKDDLQQKLNYREHHCPQYINFCHSVTVKIYSRYNLFEGGSSHRKYEPSFK